MYKMIPYTVKDVNRIYAKINLYGNGHLHKLSQVSVKVILRKLIPHVFGGDARIFQKVQEYPFHGRKFYDLFFHDRYPADDRFHIVLRRVAAGYLRSVMLEFFIIVI